MVWMITCPATCLGSFSLLALLDLLLHESSRLSLIALFEFEAG